MTHSTEPATHSLPFTDSEWAALQKDDVQAGGAVVCLMAGIFTIGLVIYSLVLWAVMAN